MSSTIILILLILILLALIVLIQRIQSTQQPDEAVLKYLKSDMESLKDSIDDTKETMHKTLHKSNKDISESLQDQTKSIHKRLEKASEVIGELKKEAGQFTEISRSMQQLQEFLQSPKLRGNIGETVLKDLISQMFPQNSFHLQYTFKSGDKVDAAIKTDAGILPIDSKFPMDTFQKMMEEDTEKQKTKLRKKFINEIRGHIRDISKKYILPEEDTLDFALMYIPSESVYYEVALDPDLTEYARSHRVYPVSPNTMYAALQTILLSFEGKKIERKAKEVFRMLRAIQKDYENTEDTVSVLGKHLKNAYNKYSDVQQNFNLLGQKISSTRQLTGEIEEENLIEE